MIDWITGTIPLSWDKPINEGQFVKVRPDGQIEWVIDRRKVVEGSYSATIAVRTIKRGYIEVSGNPAKFLQGHNLFGTDDLCHLVSLFMEILCGYLSIQPADADRMAWKNGDFEMSRIDINYMFPLRSRSDVRAWLRAAAETTRVKRKNSTYRDGTLYFGMANKGERAKDYQIKIYCKADEMGIPDVPLNADEWEASRRRPVVLQLDPIMPKVPWVPDRKAPARPGPDDGWGGNLPANIPCRWKLAQWADDKLRIEVTIRSRELKRLGLRRGIMWSPVIVREVFEQYYRRVEIGEATMVPVEDVEKLPRALRRTYNEWKLGVDVRQEVSKATFFRHRAAIKEALGVDIAVPQPKSATVIPLRRAIVLGEIAPLPEWAPPAICVRAA